MPEVVGKKGLVLTRRAGESVKVKTPDGHVLLVTVDAIEGNRVRLRLIDPTHHFDLSRPKEDGSRDESSINAR
jgi:hypothetical protein